jgi:hypothetical protein
MASRQSAPRLLVWKIAIPTMLALPVSMVLISQTGTLLPYHEGLFPEMSETLKRELRDSVTK